MGTRADQPGGQGFRRQVVFRIGEEDWPHLASAAREQGGIQAGIIAALRAYAAQRLTPPPAAAAESAPERREDELPDSKQEEQAARPSPARRVQEKKESAVRRPASELVELNVAEAAPLLGIRLETLRAGIKRGDRPGRQTETGFYLARLEPDLLRQANPPLTLRGAAELLGRKPGTLRAHCRAGRYPNAYHDGCGWRIPARDLL